jgi:hypothetical protein
MAGRLGIGLLVGVMCWAGTDAIAGGRRWCGPIVVTSCVPQVTQTVPGAAPAGPVTSVSRYWPESSEPGPGSQATPGYRAAPDTADDGTNYSWPSDSSEHTGYPWPPS